MRQKSLQIPWHQLTHIYAVSPAIWDLLDYVKASTALQSLEFANVLTREEDAHTPVDEDLVLPIVSAPTLRHLRITGYVEERQPPYLFDHLLDLTLESLYLQSETNTGRSIQEIDIDSVARLLSNSSLTLTNMSLVGIPFPYHGDIAPALGNLPQLTTLKLLYSPYIACGSPHKDNDACTQLYSSLVQSMHMHHASRKTSSVFLPSLQHLELQYFSLAKSLKDVELMEMVQSRCGPLLQRFNLQEKLEGSAFVPGVLRTAHITVRGHAFSEKAIEIFRVLKLAGLGTSLQGKDGYVASI